MTKEDEMELRSAKLDVESLVTWSHYLFFVF